MVLALLTRLCSLLPLLVPPPPQDSLDDQIIGFFSKQWKNYIPVHLITNMNQNLQEEKEKKSMCQPPSSNKCNAPSTGEGKPVS